MRALLADTFAAIELVISAMQGEIILMILAIIYAFIRLFTVGIKYGYIRRKKS